MVVLTIQLISVFIGGYIFQQAWNSVAQYFGAMPNIDYWTCFWVYAFLSMFIVKIPVTVDNMYNTDEDDEMDE